MIETRDTRTAREKAEYGERQIRAVAYAAKMGQEPAPVEFDKKASVSSNEDAYITLDVTQDPIVAKFDKKAYQRAYMRRKRAKEKE